MSGIDLSPPHMTGDELGMLADALESNWVAPLGPHVDAFEAEFAAEVGVAHAAAVSSGTAALHLALRLAGVGSADTVLVPTLTFAATANAVVYLGATPVFVDVDPLTWTIDPDLVAGELERRHRAGRPPAAVVTVDLYGQSADYDPIQEACDRYGVPLIADAAEALGATYKGRKVGQLGLIAAFSFNGNKVITTSGGGMLVSDDEALVAEARHLAAQAKVPGSDYVHETLGYNYRLSNLLAAVGRAQLRVLGDRVRARQRNFSFYERGLHDLEGLGFMPDAGYGTHSRWLSIVTLEGSAPVDRRELRAALATEDIDSRPLWMPLHRQPWFDGAATVGGTVAEGLFDKSLCLPSGSALTENEIGRIIHVIRQQWD